MSPEGQDAILHIRRIGEMQKFQAQRHVQKNAERHCRELGIPTRLEEGLSRLHKKMKELGAQARIVGSAMKGFSKAFTRAQSEYELKTARDKARH